MTAGIEDISHNQDHDPVRSVLGDSKDLRIDQGKDQTQDDHPRDQLQDRIRGLQHPPPREHLLQVQVM